MHQMRVWSASGGLTPNMKSCTNGYEACPDSETYAEPYAGQDSSHSSKRAPCSPALPASILDR